MATIYFNEESFNEAINNNKVVLADFFATWCNPCKMLSGVIDAIAEKYQGKAVVGKIDIEENSDLAVKYEVATVPTMHFFVDGKLVETLIGYKQQQEIEKVLDSYL